MNNPTKHSDRRRRPMDVDLQYTGCASSIDAARLMSRSRSGSSHGSLFVHRRRPGSPRGQAHQHRRDRQRPAQEGPTAHSIATNRGCRIGVIASQNGFICSHRIHDPADQAAQRRQSDRHQDRVPDGPARQQDVATSTSCTSLPRSTGPVPGCIQGPRCWL